MLPPSPSSQQRLASLSRPHSSFPLHQAMASHQPKRLRHAESMAQRSIQRGRPSVKHATTAPYGAPKAWQCGWDNNGSGPVCQKSFGRKSDLQRHHHTHTGTRNHACTFEGCGKTFIQTSALTVHMRTHTGEKPHECSVCSKRFSDSSSLARHRKIHSNERPYPCEVEYCDKSFCRKSTLHKHVERDHPNLALSRADEDGWYDEGDISPITPGDDVASEIPWSASSEGIMSPFATLPSQNFSPQQRPHPQISRSPFTTIRQRGTPDPSYRNYPHPNLSMGQVQNLSSADVRGYPSQAMVSPPNLTHSRQNSASRIATWSPNNGSQTTAQMNLPMQNSANVVAQRAIVRDDYEYAPRSAPIGNYQTSFPYGNMQHIHGPIKHEHRRSASDVSGMVFSQQPHRDFSQRHSVDAVHFNEQPVHVRTFKFSQQQQQQSQQDSEPPQLYQEPQYVHNSVEFSQQQQAPNHQVPQQSGASYDSIVASGYEQQHFEAYQEPQDIGVINNQTYGIPMGYDLGLSAVGLDEDKYKYLDTFGEPLPSQLIQ